MFLFQDGCVEWFDDYVDFLIRLAEREARARHWAAGRRIVACLRRLRERTDPALVRIFCVDTEGVIWCRFPCPGHAYEQMAVAAKTATEFGLVPTFSRSGKALFIGGGTVRPADDCPAG